MKFKRLLSAVLAVFMLLTVTPAVFADDPDYGTASTGADGSVTLNFGYDSIIKSAHHSKETMVTDKTYNVLRADYFQTDSSGEATLGLPSVSLSDGGFTKVDIVGAVLNNMTVEIKVGDVSVASMDVFTGSWDEYKTFTADLTDSSASGNVTLNFKGKASTYAGNYVYVKFYGGSGAVTPPPVQSDEPDPEPETPYEITDAAFGDGGLTVTYRKRDDAPAGAVLFAASYTDSSESEMVEGKYIDIDGSGSQKIDIAQPETGIVKAFIWDGKDTMAPISNLKKIAFSVSSGDPIYTDPAYSFEERAADLVSRMTLEEKASQIGYKAPAIERLGVSAYDYWKEALHGVARQGKATSFPTALSMSNTWNRSLIQRMADVTSSEARAKNNRLNLSYWSPTINMARDPRWGRNEETYGEDPYLTGQLGAAFVKGMQGDDDKYLKTIATLKHFAANNNETNRSSGSSEMTEFNFRNYYTRVFQNVTEEVMPASVMSSYNATTIHRGTGIVYNFIPSLANSYLLQDLLRRNWGFDGYVTSDCGAGQYMANSSQFKQGMLGSTSKEIEEYVAQFFKNGLNVECNLSGGNWSQNYGAAMVEKGYISEEELERTVYELFLQRFRTGEFDEDVPYRNYTSADIETDANVAVAEEMAEESWVLLKNDGGALPLKNDVKNVAIVGNLADKIVLGDYTGEPTKTKTPVQGIGEELKKLNPSAEVNHLGVLSDNTLLYNVKSVNFVYSNGNKKKLDLTKATDVKGMTLTSDGQLTDVTPSAYAVIKNVDFNGVVNVEVEMSTGSRIGGSFNIAYGSVGSFATVHSTATDSLDTYVTCKLPSDITDTGGYDGVSDLIITATGAAADFSVANYKAQLDAADVIIAYAGTVPKNNTGLGDADSSESHDRSNIDLPATQSHVKAICDAYPEKTIVVMQTVGQMNVEPFMNNCKAILWTSYNGQTQGTALGKVLTGEVNPSGRLTTTWYKNSDISKMELAGGEKTVGGIKGRYTNYDIQASGSNPGHTYQYYGGTPIYPFGYGLGYTSFEYSNMTEDKSSVDANGEITFTVDVKNSGTVAGKEVVQLYVAHPNAGSGNTPKKQLKGFEKVELQPGESKTVTIKLNVRDMYLFDESAQRDIVPAGTYTAYLAKNADDVSNSKTFTVSGTLNSTIKTVKAIPDGISVNGLIREDGSALEAKTKINANLSAVMSDELVYDLSKATVKYESSNDSVATVDQDGIVSSGTREGVAVITASVTINGETKSTSFPVVNKLEIKPSEAEINEALASLKAAYDALPKAAYSEENWAEVEKIYEHGVSEINAAQTKAELDNILAQKINNMNSVPLDNLSVTYSINSVNPEHIVNGVIDYREGGIPAYSGASGTVTNAAPYGGIMLEAKDASGNKIDNSKLVWQIKKFDSSVRKVAEINGETGELTVYGNGIVQITAADIENLTCGTLMVQINMQIEGEYADDNGGADLSDNQSGSSGGHDAGSTGNAWMLYKSVKLSNLESIVARVAGKNAGVVNVSLAKDTLPDNLIATKSISATGGWSTWSDETLTLNNEVVYNALQSGKLDEYGCADIYIQTNGINLDYFRMNYIENNDEVPYTIDKVLNKADGKIKVTLGYRGSTLATDVTLAADVNGSEVTATVKGTGEYELNTGAADNTAMTIVVKDGERNLSEVYSHTYKVPLESEIVVYSLSSNYSGGNDYSKLSGGADEDHYTPVGDLGGYGSWTLKDNKAAYTYLDVNEKAYEYSFTRSWNAGQGGTSKRCLYFTPKAPCKISAIFNGSEEVRSMKIEQNGRTVVEPGRGKIAAVVFETEDTENPVYVYGGSKSKDLYAIIVEYYGQGGTASASADEDFDRAVQFADWNGTRAVLTKNDLTGETKVWTENADGSRTRLSTEYFYENDIPYSYDDTYTINTLAPYKDRLYAGCDSGVVLVFTECIKCYKLKKAADIDIKDMKIEDGIMYVSDGTTDIQIDMSDLGADIIAIDEANVLIANGAKLIDVRTPEEFAERSAEGSINLPLDTLETALRDYDINTVLLFFCASGNRAGQAVKKANEMGFERAYNLGSIDNL